MFSSIILKAQSSQIHYYYIEEASYDLLKPTSQTERQDGSKSLDFADENITTFFEGFKILSYVREFEFSTDPKHHKYYLVGLDSDDKVQELQNINAVVFAEYVGTREYETLGSPSDYFDHSTLNQHWFPHPDGDVPINQPKAYEHLELINARRAWNITTGNSNIIIGIKDTQFYNDHPDIENEIMADETTSQTSNPDLTHGLSVSGIAAGETNNFGIASIGYNSRLVPTNKFGLSYGAATLYLTQNYPQVKVVNISMGSTCCESQTEANIFEDIWNKGVTVVVAAGNGVFQSETNSNNYFWPASYEHVISVSSVGSYHKYGFIDPQGKEYDVRDVHEVALGHSDYTHQHNDSIDIVAPGYSVARLVGFDEYKLGYGTSYAAPMVAGTVALMHDVYPDIQPDDVKRILQETAVDISHIPENQAYDGLLGAGRLNAYAAVLKAECEYNNNPGGLDLYMQNSGDDFGDEPDVDTGTIWRSPDIWVRNQQDGHLYKQSQKLQYVDNSTPVYVYVIVTNDSCQQSSGEEELKLYWAKGGLNQTWPDVWNGSSNPTNGFGVGNIVGIQNIPELITGESTILEFEWYPQNPDVYENAGFDRPWIFSFLGRIVTPDDPMTFPEVANVTTNVRNNNNIAYKNETVINVSSNLKKGTIVVGNLGGETPLTSSIEFSTSNTNDNKMWQESEVYAQLDDDLWEAWQNSDASSKNASVADPDKKLILLNSNKAKLENINFGANEWGKITISVNFLVKEVENFEGYDLHIKQTDTTTDEVLGGFTYTITRDNSRQDFTANDETEIGDNNSRTIKATNINEPATYNWYDEDGNLIYSGDELIVNTAIAQEYKLEVIAESDGHKDYHTVMTEDLRKIESINPNPANTQVTLQYVIEAGDNAIIKLTQVTNGTFYNYILDNSQDTIDIDLTNFSSGQYIVNLMLGGQILDTQNLIIN